MPDSPTVPWEDALRDAYLEGRANVFLLHGAVYDFQFDPTEGFLSLGESVGQLLGRSRSFVVTVDGAGDAELSHADKPATVRSAFSWARPGTRDIAEVLNGGPTVLLPALGRLLCAPAHPCGVVLLQAELLLTSPASVAKVRRWLDAPGIRQTNNVAVLIADRADALPTQLLQHPRLCALRVGRPSAAVRVAALRNELGDRLAGVPDARLALATHEHTLIEVAALCSRLAGATAESVSQHFPHGADAPMGDSAAPESEPAVESIDA